MSNTASSLKRDPDAIWSQRTSFWFGSLIALVIGVGFTALAVHEMRHVLHYALLFGADIYAFMAVMYFWFSKSFKDGVTVREFFRNLFWFWGLGKLVGSAKKQGFRNRTKLHVSDDDHHTPVLDWHILPGTKSAVFIGVIVSLLALVAIPLLMIWHLFHMFFSLVWLVVAVWSVCDALYFFGGRVWKGGITKGELFGLVFGGPFAVFTRAARFASNLHKQKISRTQPVPATA
jgi:hypothetical protein